MAQLSTVAVPAHLIGKRSVGTGEHSAYKLDLDSPSSLTLLHRALGTGREIVEPKTLPARLRPREVCGSSFPGHPNHPPNPPDAFTAPAHSRTITSGYTFRSPNAPRRSHPDHERAARRRRFVVANLLWTKSGKNQTRSITAPRSHPPG